MDSQVSDGVESELLDSMSDSEAEAVVTEEDPTDCRDSHGFLDSATEDASEDDQSVEEDSPGGSNEQSSEGTESSDADLDGDRALQDGTSSNEEEETGMTELHVAAECGDVATVQQLLREGHAVGAATSPSMLTPLHIAARNGHVNVVRLLLQRPVNIEAETAEVQGRPLHEAAAWGHLAVVKLLAESGAELDAPTGGGEEGGNTAMHLAALNGFSDIVAFLIQQPEVDLWAPNGRGFCPLVLAAREGNAGVVQQLLDELPPGSEDSPVVRGLLCDAAHYAVKFKHQEVLPPLLQLLGPDFTDMEWFQEAREREFEDECFQTVVAAWRMSRAQRPMADEWAELRAARQHAQKEADELRVGAQQLLVQSAVVVRQALRLQEQDQQHQQGFYQSVQNAKEHGSKKHNKKAKLVGRPAQHGTTPEQPWNMHEQQQEQQGRESTQKTKHERQGDALFAGADKQQQQRQQGQQQRQDQQQRQHQQPGVDSKNRKHKKEKKKEKAQCLPADADVAGPAQLQQPQEASRNGQEEQQHSKNTKSGQQGSRKRKHAQTADDQAVLQQGQEQEQGTKKRKHTEAGNSQAALQQQQKGQEEQQEQGSKKKSKKRKKQALEHEPRDAAGEVGASPASASKRREKH